jgi:hypothetical protein
LNEIRQVISVLDPLKRTGAFARMKLWRKKKEEARASPKEAEREPGLLEKLCSDDKALYEDLSWSMYLDPRGKGTCAEAMKKAEAFEREQKKSEAAREYRQAGALALYEGNVDEVKRAFDKSAELSQRKLPRIREAPDKAVEIARHYYEKELKTRTA